MPPADQTPETPPELDWRDDVIPVSRRFDDPYFSLAGGLEETRHVFLAGNDLPARLCEGFQVAELGFGTGLNLLALLAEHRGPARVHYTSFEAFPLPAAEMERAHRAFPELDEISQRLLGQWANGARELKFPNLTARIVVGDARQTLPAWEGRADAWFLDGFSPAKNPELWSDDLMRAVASHTAPGGTFATYTAAGHVRRALADAGFEVSRRPGFGRKRHMTTGRLANL
ncbi:tRNA (5-methylaminomethyl-2-thiouridine)(34)-methyltransferase MnmD [Tabrizicola flagellatus]|uniref:tRNA (5-methylaminomethyl-2-thiouridine)(34)-methyltransferase MnmD n=1 Tax=Tabrizicola flagellatus TaxID=2593021 RepID=UPI0011F0B776|nr:tRNA (5-methylaminomethyl-2-thiouridine)(34)-methyltransferase MnmD [Tabrizicola flagellatus]